MNRKLSFLIASILIISVITFYINGLTKAKSLGSNEQSLYQKIQSGQNFNYIVIGDSIGRGSGAETPSGTWFSQLEAMLHHHYHVSGEHFPVVQSGATAFEGLVKFQQEKPRKNIDLAFIVFGENDRKYMKANQFSYYYEKLLHDVKKNYPNAEIITITESCLQQEPFAKVIKGLSAQYKAVNIDMRIPFRLSAIPPEKLTRDLVHPNTKGYQLYAKELFKVISENTRKQKVIKTELPSPQHNRLDINFISVTKPAYVKGFKLNGPYYVSNRKGDSIEYEFIGRMAGVTVVRTEQGGKMDVFLDGKFVTSISTWWPFERVRNLYVTSGLSGGVHRITFVNTGVGTHTKKDFIGELQISSLIVPTTKP